MSTSRRRRGQSLHLDLSAGVNDEPPSVAAVFLVLFEVKVGYTIAWQRSIPGLDLDESVEYKSLPSGLHNVNEDLIYFIHGDDYAGISAFANSPAEVDRNALMLAVGALAPLSYGRLGKSWKHAEGLKELARELVRNPSTTKPLDEFWDSYQTRDEGSPGNSRTNSPSVDRAKKRQSQGHQNGGTRGRKRAISTASALAPPTHLLSPHHPALSLPTFLDMFGPLVFPIYKAALLRQRLLIVGPAPVELPCNFVYDISILSGIPSSVVDLPTLEPLPTRLPALFSVGIHDIPFLSSPKFSTPEGWVACTTDGILAHKTQLYDTLVMMPSVPIDDLKRKAWPRIRSHSGMDIKATQRDLRRYGALKHELTAATDNAGRSPFTSKSTSKRNSFFQNVSNQSSSNLSIIENAQSSYDDVASAADANIVEPQSWSALAYDSFMWWASAGEKRTDLEEEAEADRAFLPAVAMNTAAQSSRDGLGDQEAARASGDFNTMTPSSGKGTAAPASTETSTAPTTSGNLETSIIAYFHRLTERLFTVLADIIDSQSGPEHGGTVYKDDEQEASTQTSPPGNSTDQRVPGNLSDGRGSNGLDTSRDNDDDNDDDDDEREDAIEISSDDMIRMGLDTWSETDRAFVRDLVDLYWGRKCAVPRSGVECCGVRIC